MEQLGERIRTDRLDSEMSFSIARRRRPRNTPAIMLLVCALLFAVPRAVASPRLWQPLILRGIQIQPLLNTRVDRLEVLAMNGGKLEPIPFQVDAVLPNGMFVLPQGSLPSTGHQCADGRRLG